MTGPPTPPITSAIEIEDAARAANAAEAPAVALGTPAQAVAPFRKSFALLAELAAQGKFQELVQEAEVADLNTMHDNEVERFLVTVPLVLGYLILDDAAPAINAIMRLPDNLKNEQIAQVLFRLCASVSERKYQNVYVRAQEVHKAIQSTTIPEVDFAMIVNGLLSSFVEAFRSNTLVLLSKGYSSIPLVSAQIYLGCSSEQVVSAAAQNKWKYDEDTHLLSPVLITVAGKGAPTNQSSITTLSMVVNSNLE
ncbi:hypothetical protein PHLGIDRAFT_98287 [Phlebiopsis gigantea 11061_1 CR5-6]|uniref:CSN8/PSMD8/EIF3K domain-containing protein n=1 Tax=Phlebiopsis gigantea (strain 11061_1 CR5-6) TaxID=745531 RepID=A0A0C3SFM1_PHLG1|nr:hypothetical protein PHLGIDRAFT_98287 [Phlebiopsis gigantea 11061_1 CR5-6]